MTGERGTAVLIAVLLALLLGAVAAAILSITSMETLIAASFRHSREAAYGAEAGLERALHDLASTADWSLVLFPPPGNVASTFADGQTRPRAPDGRVLDLAALTAERQAESDAQDGPGAFGADSPQWRLHAHAPLGALLPPGRPALPLYVVVWVADDELDGDGDPGADANGRLRVWATAFGTAAARRRVEALVAKTTTGELQVLSWNGQ